MATPKFKVSKSKRDTRRAHHALTVTRGTSCPNCGDLKHPHSVCEACGHYKGRQVVEARSATSDFEASFDGEA